MTKRYRLSRYTWGDQQHEPIEVDVDLTAREHWMTGTHRGQRMMAYDVTVGGEVRGRIERAVESTDRHYGRIRVAGRGRLAWGWRRVDGETNRPGSYEANIASAVARVLGYDRGEVIPC